MNPERQKRINELDAEIRRITDEDNREAGKDILSFLKKHFDLLYDGNFYSYPIVVKPEYNSLSTELELELIDLAKKNGNQNSLDSFTASVSEYFDIEIESGNFYLEINFQRYIQSLNIKGKVTDDMKIEELKKLGINSRIGDYVVALKKEIQKYQSKIDIAERFKNELNLD